MQITGTDAPDECISYSKGKGPFENYIVTYIYRNSACANCHYNLEGKRCNFHQSYEAATPKASKGKRKMTDAS